ncbi:MAG: PD-(D/E)XK nuclease family protein [Actinomycetota bacterium]
MPISVRWTPPGLPLAREVSETIRALQGDDPLQLVRVIAPDGATVDGLRRALPLAGGSCGAEIGGTLRLANAIAAPELGTRRVAPPVALLAIVQQVLANEQTRPPAFAACASHPATHDAVVRSYATLNGVFTLPGNHTAHLAHLAELAGGRDSANAVCRVVVEVRNSLLAQGLIDAAEVIGIATRLATTDPTVTSSPLVLVVPQQFNPAHVAFLQAMVASAPTTVIIAATTRDPEASVADHVDRLAGSERTTRDRPEANDSSGVVPTVVSCPDHDEEVREVTRRVVALLEAGVVADRIAVFYPPAGPHRAAIAASLGAAGVAARGQVTPPLHGSVAGQVLRALLALVSGGLDRRTLVEISRVAPFGHDVDSAGMVRTYARRGDVWNRYAQRFGVVGERDWSAFEAAEPPSDHADHARHRALAGFVRLQRHHRDAVRGATTWPAAAAALEAWLATHCGTVEWRLDTWKGYPSWQREAAEQVEGLFAMLAEVDQFGLPLRTSTLVRLVTAFLDTDVVTAESKGAGVFVDQIVGAAGAVFDHAFVLGVNDHLLPGRVADDLVLTRHHGAEPLGVLTGPANRPLRDRRGLLAALDGATHSVTLLYARWDLRSGGQLYPSPLIPPQSVTSEHVASHAARLTSPTDPWLDADEWFTRDVTRTTPGLSRRRRAITGRAQDRPGEFDGQVGPLGSANPLTHQDPLGEPAQTGITSLEDWVTCGLKYFVTRVLGARTDDTDPTDIADIEPREKGTLVHAVFEQLISEWLADNSAGVLPWVATEAAVEVTARRAEQVLDEFADALLAGHRLGHPEMWRARRAQILSALRRGLEAELVDQVVPIAAEFAFGRRQSAETVPAAVWRAPDGELEVHFTGAVDRVDRLADGSLRVMDLKSGRADPFRKITELDPLGPDRDKLQLAFYGWAVEQLMHQPVSRAAYRFVGRPEPDADITLAITDQVIAQLHARVHQIVDAVAEGVFEPGQVGQWGCEVCAPDGLGTFEINQRRLEWHALVTDGPDE